MNNTLLLQAASGLEPLLTSSKNKEISDQSVAQISAILYYKANVVGHLENSPSFKQSFKKIIFSQLQKDFGLYMDAQARSKPKMLHHIYEWQKIGNEKARLFKLNQIPSTGISFKVGYEFLQSKSPVPGNSKKKFIFANKAQIMEQGRIVNISPKNANRIVFEGRFGTVFMPVGRSVTVKRPGGIGVKNSFESFRKRWFTGNLVNESIKRSGFHQFFGQAFKNSLNIPSSLKSVKYSFSPNTIRYEASLALEKEFGKGML